MQKTIRIDDIDGGPDADETVFEVAGTLYTIDLTAPNQARLMAALSPFIERARVVRSQRAQRAPARHVAAVRTGQVERDFDLEKLKRWADEHSVQLPSRGRIPGVIVAQYKAAGGK